MKAAWCVLICTASMAIPVAAQDTAEGALPPAPYDEYTGLYVMDNGGEYVVFNLVDQVRSPLLVGLDPAAGTVRTLYPVDTSATNVKFDAGSGWFARDSSDYSVEFVKGDMGVTGLRMTVGRAVVHGERAMFEERDVVFQNGGDTIAGSLVLPPGPGPHPIMVMVHGSGPLTRRVPRYMAHLMAQRGVGALVYDKRGTGASEGDWRAASHEILAGDVSAAVDLLLRQPDVDSTRIGLFGSSEGGYVVPVVAARHPAVSLLVCRVCPALPQYLVAPVSQRSELSRLGFAGDTLNEALAFHQRILAYVASDTGYATLEQEFARLRDRRWMERYRWERVPPPDAPYWRAFRGVMLLDPREYYRQLDIPVLVLLAENDESIDVAEHRAAFSAASDQHSSDFVIEVMENASHGMMEERQNAMGEPLPFDRFVPRFHDYVLHWIARHFNVEVLRKGSAVGIRATSSNADPSGAAHL